MKTSILDKCLKQLRMDQIQPDKNKKVKISNCNFPSLEREYLNPFQREITINILENHDLSTIREIIKFYIIELSSVSEIFTCNTDLIFDQSDDLPELNFHIFKQIQSSLPEVTEIDDSHKDNELIMFERYFTNNFELFKGMYDVIISSCNKYAFDFLKLCDESKVDSLIYKAIEISRQRERSKFNNSLVYNLLSDHSPQDISYHIHLLTRNPKSNPSSWIERLVHDHIFSKGQSKDNIGMLEEHQTENLEERNDVKIISSPIFKEDKREDVYKIFENYFDKKDYENFRKLINGQSKSDKKLVFLGNGIRLALAFKSLYIKRVITVTELKYLQEWIYSNFSYVHRGEIKPFKQDYLNKLISGRQIFDKNPILVIVGSEIVSKDIEKKEIINKY